jgi:hypothetical protein
MPIVGPGHGKPAVRADPHGRVRTRAAEKASRGAVNVGVTGLIAGALLEWVAPLWMALPDWLRVVASANESMMIGGAALMIGGAIVGRRVRRSAEVHDTISPDARADGDF